MAANASLATINQEIATVNELLDQIAQRLPAFKATTKLTRSAPTTENAGGWTTSESSLTVRRRPG